MTPFQGQDGTQAVEDGEAFRLFVRPSFTRDMVPSIPEDYNHVQLPRASAIQNITKQVSAKKTAEEIYAHEHFKWTYCGVNAELAKINSQAV